MGATLGNLVYFIKMNNEQMRTGTQQVVKFLGDINKSVKNNQVVLQEMSKAFKTSLDESLATHREMMTATKKREQAEKAAADAIKKSAQDTKEAWRNTSYATGAAIAALILQIKDAVKVSIDMRNSLLGLQSSSKSWGQDTAAATKAAQDLADDGLMSVADAAVGLKNLIGSGFDLDQAIILMNRFKDTAAFGKQGALSFGEAIRGATEGIKNGNSILVDNIGLTKNLSMIMKEAGFSEQDVMNVTSDLNVRMAMFHGLLKETNPYIGDAAKLSNEMGGQLQKASTASTLLRAALGDALAPVIADLSKVVVLVYNGLRSIVQSSPAVVAGVTTMTAAFAGLLAIMSAIKALELGKKIAEGFELLKTGPAGWIIGTLALIVGAITAYKTATAKAEEENRKLIASINEAKKPVDSLADSYSMLTEKLNKTKPGTGEFKKVQKEHQDLMDQIATSYPEAVRYYDKLGHVRDIDLQKLQQLINKENELTRVRAENAKKDVVNKARATLKSAQDQLESDQNELNFMQKNKGKDWINNQARDIRTQTFTTKEDSLKQASELYTVLTNQLADSIREGTKKVNDAQQLLDTTLGKKPTASEEFVCPYDNQKFGTKAAYEAHMKSAHPKRGDVKDTRTAYEIGKDQFKTKVAGGGLSLEEQLTEWQKLKSKALKKEMDDYSKKEAELSRQIAEANKKAQDELLASQMSGYALELEQLRQKEEVELKEVQAGSERDLAIRKRYQILRAELQDKHDNETKSKQSDLLAAQLEAQGKYEEAEIERENNRWRQAVSVENISLAERDRLWLEHEKNLTAIRRKYADERAEIELAKFEATKNAEIQQLENAKRLTEFYNDQNKAKLMQLQIDEQIAKKQDEIIQKQIKVLESQKQAAIDKNDNASAAKIQNSIDELKVKQEQLFADLSYSYAQYNQEIQDKWADLIKGFAKGATDWEDIWGMTMDHLLDMFIKTLLDMSAQWTWFKPIFDALSQMFGFGTPTSPAISSGTVDNPGPIVQVPKYHSGGMVQRIIDPIRAHTGMYIGQLGRDEVPAVLQTGERVLNRAETQGYNNSGSSVTQMHFNMINQSGVPLGEGRAETSFDGGRMTVNYFIEGYNRNIGNIQNLTKGK